MVAKLEIGLSMRTKIFVIVSSRAHHFELSKSGWTQCVELARFPGFRGFMFPIHTLCMYRHGDSTCWSMSLSSICMLSPIAMKVRCPVGYDDEKGDEELWHWDLTSAKLTQSNAGAIPPWPGPPWRPQRQSPFNYIGCVFQKGCVHGSCWIYERVWCCSQHPSIPGLADGACAKR